MGFSEARFLKSILITGVLLVSSSCLILGHAGSDSYEYYDDPQDLDTNNLNSSSSDYNYNYGENGVKLPPNEEYPRQEYEAVIPDFMPISTGGADFFSWPEESSYGSKFGFPQPNMTEFGQDSTVHTDNNNNNNYNWPSTNSKHVQPAESVLNEAVQTNYGYYSTKQPNFNHLVGTFKVPAQSQFKHVFRPIGGGWGKGAGLTLNKQVSPKGLLISGIFVITVYLFVALALQSPFDFLQPKCDGWGWDGVSEWEFHAEPRFIPARPADTEMQLQFLSLFKGKKVEDGKKKHEKKHKKGKNKVMGNQLNNLDKLKPKPDLLSKDKLRQESVIGIGNTGSVDKRNVDKKTEDKPKAVKKKTTKKSEDSDESGSSSEESSMEMSFDTELSYVEDMCGKDAFFYGMSPNHQNAYQTLQRMFVAQKSTEDVLHLAKLLRHNPKINQKVWYLGLLAASIERPDMLGFALPHPIDAFPDMFVPAHLVDKWGTEMDKKGRGLEVRSILEEIKDKAQALIPDKIKGVGAKKDGALQDKGKGKGDDKGKKGKKIKECVVVDGSVGVDNGDENKLWYWREDMMVNQHHIYWHQLFPVNATRHPDRRAEAFFYMHRSLLARYNAERLSNGLDQTRELQIEYGYPVIEGYDSHLADINSGQYWTSRDPMTPLADILHTRDPDFPQDIIFSEFQALYWKLVKAIEEGKILTANHGFLSIKNHKGITPLVNTAEASELSVNPFYYDSFGLHNQGHLIIALMADPEFRGKAPVGIMADAGVSMRDPAFYTYHTVLDNLFEKFKEKLPPYQIVGGEYPLLWNGIEISSVEIIPEGDGPQNELNTFYSKKKYDLAPGVDGSADTGNKTKICAVHLNHQPFQFRIAIDRKPCARSKSQQATVRISMAPRFDNKGEKLALVEQRRLMFPLDAFQVNLKIGRNVITRKDSDSSLTHPWTRHLKDLKEGVENPAGSADHCGCGWPSHLYIPKGKSEGMSFDLFVMVTNFDEDFVRDDPRDLEIPETCISPYIFCGLPNRKYPDARPMGYPFDRPPYRVSLTDCRHKFGFASFICQFLPPKHTRPVESLEEYVSRVPNMATLPFGIKHTDKVIQKWKGSS